MKSKKFKAILLICILISASVLIGCGKTTSNEPAEKKQETIADKAITAYQEILKAAPALEGEHPELTDASYSYDQNLAQFGNHIDLFALCDINKDEVPELITLSTVNFRWTPVSIYTYVDGDAILLENPLEMGAHGTFEQCSTANGAYITYICEENHIHNVWRGETPFGDTVEDNYAYSLDGGTLTLTECSVGENENTIYFYDIAKNNTAENVYALMQ